MWQALGQIYLPTPKHILRPKFDMSTPNAVHQWDLFVPHDTLGCGRGRKPYKYGLIVLDVASRVKEAEPLTSKDSAEVASVFRKIYPRGPLKYPQLHSLAENWWKTKEMEKYKTNIWRRRMEIHRDQPIMERFKRTLAECLFRHQYAVEMRLPAGQRSSEWVFRLPAVVSALNGDVMT